jgi:hypothetical protein
MKCETSIETTQLKFSNYFPRYVANYCLSCFLSICDVLSRVRHQFTALHIKYCGNEDSFV